MSYSAHNKKQDFLAGLHPSATEETRPVFVLDMDGNVGVGYRLSNGVELELSSSDDPETQSIPAGQRAEELVEQGLATRSIFAAKSNDARLAPELVEKINELADHGDHLSICLLTSRRFSDVEFILAESGIKDPDSMTIVADSGNLLHINGEVRHVRNLDETEQGFIDYVQNNLGPQLNTEVKEMLHEAGIDAENAPDLFVEHKGAAINVHFRGLFEKTGIEEESEIGQRISQHIGKALDQHVSSADAPQEEDGSPVFALGPGPMTFEVKLANVTKANGMEAIVEALNEAGRTPDHIVFAGDDCAKKADGETYGTDYYAMKWTQDNLPEQGKVIHTHHPQGGDLNGMYADPAKAAPEHLKIDLVTKTPLETAQLVVEGVVMPEKTLNPALDDAFGLS